MKIYTKLPLYLGFGVLILSVLISSKTISERRSLSNTPRASVTRADLTLEQDEKGKVTVLLTSEKEIAGVDLVIKYEVARVKILPSTLSGSNTFITSGGVLEEKEGTFSFSAIVKEGQNFKSGIVASFNLENLEGRRADLQIERGEGKTVVIEKNTGENILR